MHAILRLLLPALLLCTASYASAQPQQRLRAIDVTVHVRDHEGNPVPDIPVTASTRMWSNMFEGMWHDVTDAQGNATLRIDVLRHETYIRVQAASYEPYDTTNWSEFEALHARWAVPLATPIHIRDQAPTYHRTITLHPKAAIEARITNDDGTPARRIHLSSASIFAFTNQDKPVDSFRFDGLIRGQHNVLVGFGCFRENPRPFIIELDETQSDADVVEVAATVPPYTETTAVLDLRLDRHKDMIYERTDGNQYVTLISPDGALAYCIPREYDQRFEILAADGSGKPVYTLPTVEPGRYFIAPGQLDYPPAMKLYQHIRAGNDPTGSITEITAMEDRTIEALLDLEKLEEDIIDLLGL